ncbi:MAG: M50 family metallopeptidase [Candidatus Alcyoniella australis]|nr:M50 family metallopeptidase [Candidatus Alcyoniella australis]
MLSLIVTVVLLLWLPGVAAAFVRECLACAAQPHALQWVAVGLAAYLPLHLLAVRRWHGLLTFEHELTHALFGLLFLRRIRSFVATSRAGGQVVHEGGFGGKVGDVAISMAPYVFPTFSVALVLLRPLFTADARIFVDVAIGLTLGFHTLTTLGETWEAFRYRRFVGVDGRETVSDVARHGVLFSAVYIAFFALLYHGLLLAILAGGYGEAWEFLKAGALLGFEYAARLISWTWSVV